jgi:4-hydroxy-2-oxoheptanedioate aldolase
VTTRFKSKLEAGAVGVGVTITFAHAGMAEFLGALGFDCIIVNAEHGAIDDNELQAIATACDLTNCASMLRIVADAALLERYINLGVTGIQVPRVQSAAQVRHVVDAIKFPPQGRRGIGNSRAGRYGMWKEGLSAFMAAENERTMIMVQVEDAIGVAALPEIAGMAEVDAVLIGQFDLSSDLGVPGQLDHPTVVAAVDEIFTVAAAAGKPVGLGASTAEQLHVGIAQGARYIATSVSACLTIAATELLSALPES